LANNYFEYRSGLGNVGSYQASARPFVSSSIELSSLSTSTKISFPTVTKFVTIKNTSPISGLGAKAVARVGFSANGVETGTNYYTLASQESFSADWRVSSVYLMLDSGLLNATASVIAGCTGIDSQELAHNWSGSAGVG